MMRVEHCGDLLVEPNNSILQQPSAAISSHCTNLLQTRKAQFSELNRLEAPLIGFKLEEYILSSGSHESGGFGFTLNQEEWPLFSKSHLGKSQLIHV